MIHINNRIENDPEFKLLPIWRQAFRPFFLGGVTFSIIAIMTWSALMAGWISFNPYGTLFFWHVHEMIFGFVGAILVGFLLTAVQNWTGIRATHGRALMLLFSCWLFARILMLSNAEFLTLPRIVLDIGFYFLAAFFMARLVIKAKNTRNIMFPIILIVLGLLNVLSHIAIMYNQHEYLSIASRSAIFLITLVMTLIAGRVFPAFTANGTKTPKRMPIVFIEKAAISLIATITILHIFNVIYELPGYIMTGLFITAGAVNIIRAINWAPWVTLKAPIVWSLHLAHFFIPVAYFLFSLHFYNNSIPYSVGLHALTVGAMSTLILAMISRITLGHTGRTIVPPKFMRIAFLCLALAGVARILVGINPNIFFINGYVVTAILWCAGFSMYLFHYTPILIKPRADGRPG